MTRHMAVHRWDGVLSKILGAACMRYGAKDIYTGMVSAYNRAAIEADQISESTLRRRMGEPGKLSLDELYRLSRVLGLELTVRLEDPRGEDA